MERTASSFRELLNVCEGYRKIVVAGPQRSGTTFTAKTLASELGVNYVDEFSSPKTDEYVWQYAAKSESVHLNDFDFVIWMIRDKEDVEASERRIKWKYFENHKAEYERVFGSSDINNNYDMKHYYWNNIQRDALNADYVEFKYSNLKDAPGFLPKEKRVHFKPKQTEL